MDCIFFLDHFLDQFLDHYLEIFIRGGGKHTISTQEEVG